MSKTEDCTRFLWWQEHCSGTLATLWVTGWGSMRQKRFPTARTNSNFPAVSVETDKNPAGHFWEDVLVLAQNTMPPAAMAFCSVSWKADTTFWPLPRLRHRCLSKLVHHLRPWLHYLSHSWGLQDFRAGTSPPEARCGSPRAPSTWLKTGGLIDWLTGWMTARLAYRLAYWLTYRLFHWLAGLLTDWMSGQ